MPRPTTQGSVSLYSVATVSKEGWLVVQAMNDLEAGQQYLAAFLWLILIKMAHLTEVVIDGSHTIVCLHQQERPAFSDWALSGACW